MTGETIVRYLPAEEKPRTRQLWEEAFSEDSPSFIDYYYKEKTRDNRVLVKEEDGRIVSMLHRNPYVMNVGGTTERIDYVVGVATAADSRHRGHMSTLLSRMFQDMYEEQMPFAFLMPADQAIYRPFQFAMICDAVDWEEQGLSAQEAGGEIRRTGVTRDNEQEAADYMNRWLEARYQVYCVRDRAYVDRLLKELDSENGSMEILSAAEVRPGQGAAGEESVCGLQAFWGLRKQEQRLLMTEDGLSRQIPAKEDHPGIMARIIWLPGFLAPVCLAPSHAKEEERLLLKLHDPMIAENDGEFLWTVGKDGSALCPAAAGDLEDEELTLVELTVSLLTQWIFGYGDGAALSAVYPYIQTLDRIFIDEII